VTRGACMRERMTPIFNGRVLALALGLAVCGCSGAARLDQDQQLATPTSTALRAGDWIKVTVVGDASLSGDFQIDPTGSVLLPLAGPTKAAGLTPSELAQALAKRYRAEYVKNPNVTVSGPRGG
jgi:protein involved in polysaccharide export with SLBB domain